MKKLSTKITAAVLVVLLIGLTCLYLVTEANVRSMAQSSAQERMTDAVTGRVNLVDEYVSSIEKTVITWAQTDIFQIYCRQVNGSLTESDPIYNPNAGDIANNFMTLVQQNVYPDRFEGVWACDSTTQVFAHSNPDGTGTYLRETPEEQQALLELLDPVEADAVYNAGIRQSTVTGQLLLVVYYPIRDVNGAVIGVTGCGAYMQPLLETFDANPVEGMEHATYYMLDLDKNSYLFNSEDASLIGAEVSGGMLSLMNGTAGQESGFAEFVDDATGVATVAAYKKVPGHNWLFVVKDTQSEIYADVNSISVKVLLICLIVAIVLAVVTFIVISLMTKGLPVIAGAIERFGNLDFRVKGELEGYIKKKDEVGQMARASKTMARSLRQFVTQLNDCRTDIGNTAGTLGGATQELSDCVTNNAAVTEELFASITNTNQSVSDVEGAVASVFDSIEDVTEKVDNSDNITKQLIARSADIKRSATESLESGTENIKHHKQRVDEAVTSLKAIENVNIMADEILEISSQTNLLSLNASIEAARAGEAGKGFAVVAMEIQKLAEQSASTASKIQEIVKDSNVSIENVRECFSDIISYLDHDILKNFEGFAKAADEYGEQSDQIGIQIKAITESMHELKRYMQDIVDSAKAVSMAAEQNEQAVTEIVQKNENMQNVSDRVAEISGTNTTNSEQIGDVVGQFKL